MEIAKYQELLMLLKLINLLNHLGKMAFRWVYWNILLPGWPIPLVGHKMSLRGKNIPPKEIKAAA